MAKIVVGVRVMVRVCVKVGHRNRVAVGFRTRTMGFLMR